MADNTALNAWDQANMARSTRQLTSLAGALVRDTRNLREAKDQFLALGLDLLISANGVGDHVHKDGDAPTKQQLLDLSSLVDYLRKVLLNDGTVSTMTPAQARTILDRYVAG